MPDPLERVRQAFPIALPRMLSEMVQTAFGEALVISRKYVEQPERPAMLGQLRHARCEAAIRQAAEAAGLAYRTPHTKPLGGRYSVVTSGNVVMLRNPICRDSSPLGIAKFRKDFARINGWLDTLQLDMLQDVQPLSADRLCTMLVIASNPRIGDPSVPDFIGLGIPRSDLSGWYKLLSLTEWLALYHDADTAGHVIKAKEAVVRDDAQPKLKKGGPPIVGGSAS